MTPRLLFLSQLVPYPLDAGPKVRAYHVLGWLAARTDVTLLAYRRSDDDEAALDHLRTICREVRTVPMQRSRLADARDLAGAIATNESFIIRRDRRASMDAALTDLAGRADFYAVHADQLWMAHYGAVAGGSRTRPYRVLDNHNAVFRVFERLAEHERVWPKRWLWRREARLIARYEAQMTARFDHTLFVSEVDRQAVRGAAEKNGVATERWERTTSVLPICVDVAAASMAARPVTPPPNARRVLFLGGLHWPPNAEGALWFAEHVFGRVLEAVPDARFTIVGKGAPPALAAFAERSRGAVELAGYVRDLGPLLAETAAFIVPLRSGGGMRVKILDAWAWGLPVVSTTVGAEGIVVAPGEDIIIADTVDAFAAAVTELLRGPDRRRELGAAGRRTVAARYDARTVYNGLASVYASVLSD